jgi:hypothetical protein
VQSAGIAVDVSKSAVCSSRYTDCQVYAHLDRVTLTVRPRRCAAHEEAERRVLVVPEMRVRAF